MGLTPTSRLDIATLLCRFVCLVSSLPIRPSHPSSQAVPLHFGVLDAGDCELLDRGSDIMLTGLLDGFDGIWSRPR